MYDRLQQRLVMHHPDTAQAQHIGDLMRVCEHRCRAMRDDGGREFRRSQHAAFDVHVSVAKAGYQELAGRIHHLGLRPDAMRGIRPDIGKAPLGHSYLPTWQHLAALHINQRTALDDQIGGSAPGSHSHQSRGTISPRRKRRFCHEELEPILPGVSRINCTN